MLHAVTHIHSAVVDLTELAEIDALRSVGECTGHHLPVPFVYPCVEHRTLAIIIGLAVTRRRGNEESHYDAGHRGVYARIVEQNPYNDGQEDIRGHFLFSQSPEYQGDDYYAEGDCQEPDVYRPSIEYRHYEDGHQVVRYGECGQKYFKGYRDLVSQYGQDAYGECDIGGRRDTPAGGRRSAVVHKDVNEGRSQHAAQSGDDGKHGLFGRGELSGRDFTLDFQADGEEEDHHQDVVDELLYVHVAREQDVDLAVRTGQMYLHGSLKEILVQDPCHREVGQEHRDYYAYEKQNSLEPGLPGQVSGGIANLDDSFVPRIYGNESHFRFRLLNFQR